MSALFPFTILTIKYSWRSDITNFLRISYIIIRGMKDMSRYLDVLLKHAHRNGIINMSYDSQLLIEFHFLRQTNVGCLPLTYSEFVFS